MMAAAVLIPALICALAALALRRRLRSLSWISWLGWVLIGAGVPVLIGQVAGYMLAVNGGEARLVALLLAAGLSGGLGWGAGALSARVTGGPR